MRKRLQESGELDESIYELERQLAQSLNPVRPDPAFVNQLRTRLSNPNYVALERSSRATVFLVVATGLFAGMLVMWLMKRLS